MNTISISEAGSVQYPMVKHAEEIGWKPLSPEIAKQLRGGEDGLYLHAELISKLLTFNDWLTPDAARSIVETIEAIAPTVEGNREILSWLRGEKQWYDENEKCHRRIKLIDFENIEANTLHVSWEWTVKPPARKGNRADVIFLVNGIPVCIVEHKNPKNRDAIEHAIKQIRRYELETPELIGSPQIFNVTHLLDYWYGVTWNVTRRDMARWKQIPEETYRFAVQSFFEPTDFLRTLQHWILFYVQDNETRKSILRQHQRAAIEAILNRCADPQKNRGLIWHTQGSGKTFTLLTASKLILEDKNRFQNATVILVVDRTELEGQLKGWVERLLGEMQKQDIAIEKAYSKNRLQELFDADFRGLIITMIHKFEEIRKDSCLRDNVYVLIDEAHRSVAKDFGTYMMGAVPKSTIIGFTGTPIDRTAYGEGTFKIFGMQDEKLYLHRYSIRESIDDETTLPIKYMLAPSEITLPTEQLDKEFLDLAESEGITDIGELSRVLERAVGIQTFLTADDHIDKAAEFIANHFKENVAPLGYKAFVVAINREACAKYKEALDKFLPSEWSQPIYTKNQNDITERPLAHKWQLSEEGEEDARSLFKKPTENLKILIVTDKLLTGYDAPLLYCMYLDKPMRDHVLLQALARVNRPYIDSNDNRKRIGLVVDFVGILRNLNKALKFDSSDVSGIIEDLDLLLEDFKKKMHRAEKEHLYVETPEGADEKLESIIYGHLFDPEIRKKFFEEYKEIENLWEILSPSEELRDYIKSYKQLAGLYSAVRNAYAEKHGFISDLANKTRELIAENVTKDGLGRLTKSITFDLQTLEAVNSGKGSDEKKVIDLIRIIHTEIDAKPETAPVLQPLKERADRILKDLENRHITGMTAMDHLANLAKERDAAKKAAKESGLSSKGFSVYWTLQTDSFFLTSGLTPLSVAQEIEKLLTRFPNASVNSDEHRRLRASIYAPLLALPKEERSRIVDHIMGIILR